MIGKTETGQKVPPFKGSWLLLRTRVLFSGAVLLVIPILFLVAVLQLTKARGPQWMPYTFENPYNYLLSSLLLAKGQSPPYIMHPGTTTQVFGAVMLRASSLKPVDELVEDTLRKPEKHIKLLHRALLIFTVLLLWIAPWITAVALKNNIFPLLIQAPCLFSQTFWWWHIQFGPELMLVGFSVAAVCCCVLLLLPSSFPEKFVAFFGFRVGSSNLDQPRLLRLQVPILPALTGMICAVGLVTKLTFFPLILIGLFCCWTRRKLTAFVFAFFLTLALALLPIYPQLPKLGAWIFNLGVHSEQYGRGAVGLPPLNEYLSNLSSFLQSEPTLAIGLISTAMVLILLTLLPRDRTDAPRLSWQSALAVFGIQLISYLTIGKQTELRYLIPLSLSLGLSLVLLLYAAQTRRSIISKAIGWLALIGVLFLGFKEFIECIPDTYEELRTETADQLRLYRHSTEITKNDVRVDYFFSDSPEFPLCYGDGATTNAFGPLLDKLYPHRLFLDVFGLRFQTFGEYIKPEVVLQKYDHLYFLGSRKWFPKIPGFDPGTFETLDSAGDYSLQKWTRHETSDVVSPVSGGATNAALVRP